MSMSLDAAAEVFRDAMRETVKRYSLWYLVRACCWSWPASSRSSIR